MTKDAPISFKGVGKLLYVDDSLILQIEIWKRLL